MDQIYLDKPEYKSQPELEYCTKCSKRPRAKNRKSCDHCLEIARRGFWTNRHERNQKLKAKRQAARATGTCANCFNRPASPDLAWCNSCRSRNALYYANASPQVKAARAARAHARWVRDYKKIKRERRTPEGRAEERRRRHNKELLAIAREEAAKTKARLHETLARMGADARMVERWKRREERGNAQ